MSAPEAQSPDAAAPVMESVPEGKASEPTPVPPPPPADPSAAGGRRTLRLRPSLVATYLEGPAAAARRTAEDEATANDEEALAEPTQPYTLGGSAKVMPMLSEPVLEGGQLRVGGLPVVNVPNAAAGGRSSTRKVTPETTQAPAPVQHPVLAKLQFLLDHRFFVALVNVTTIYALFGSDVNNAAFSVSADLTFSNLSFIALLIFTFELLLNCIVRSSTYPFSLYFWLDFISTVSLIADIIWIWNAIIGQKGNSAGGVAALKASRASRAGSKAGRIVRIVRLVRMIRMIKLYKAKEEETSATNMPRPSNVSRTARRAVLISCEAC